MQIEIQWTQEDLERKLLEELAASGFRTIEELDGDGKPKPKFKWTFRPGLMVVVKAEPDPNAAVQEPAVKGAVPSAPFVGAPSAQTDATAVAGQSAQSLVSEVSEGDDDDSVSLDPTMFPPGTDMRAIRTLEKAAKDEQAGRPVKRRLMKGESFERPEDD